MFGTITTIKSNDEDSLLRLVIAAFAFTLVVNTINCIINVFVPNTPIDTIVCYCFFSLIILIALPTLVHRISKISIIAFFLVLILYVFAFLNPYSSEYAQGYFSRTITEAFPFFVLGQSIRDERKLTEKLKKVSPYMIVVATIYYVVILITGGGIREDYMTFSYCLLPFSSMQLLSSIEKPSFRKLVFLSLAFGVHTLTGTRGPVVCLIVCFIGGMVFSNISKKLRAFWVLFGIALVSFIVSPLFNYSAEFLNQLFLNLGIKNRIITKILSENFFVSSGRQDVANVVLNAITQRPITGFGFLGDRSVQNGGYPHNFVLEILCQFGVILGSMFLILLIYIYIKAFITRTSNRSILIMLFSASFVKLMMSGTYPVEGMFFFLLGFCLNKWLYENPTDEPDLDQIETDSVQIEKEKL